MLQPTHRLTLINAMRPPAGFRFDSAMAVTFTLDLRALLAAPAAFALTRADGLVTEDPTVEPIELLHAIRAHAGNMTVFTQAGEIALPPARKVFAFLERSVVPVTAPRHGVVHPKVWVLRYRALESPAMTRLRVLSASRNLTFDTSWDTVLRIDESASDEGCELHPVADLFEALLGQAVLARDSDHAERVNSLCGDVRRSTFARPDGVDDIRFHILGLTSAGCPLPAKADRSLIMSPFVTDDFLTRAGLAKVDQLVSNVESLDLLHPGVVASIGSVWSFDDGSNPDVAPVEAHLSPADPGRPLRGLHAKVFAFEMGDEARLFCGSANATGAAFDRNVEVLVELRGPIASLGIDRLCDGTDDERGLRALFLSYVEAAGPVEKEPSGILDGIRRKLASLALEGVVEESGDGWAVTYISKKPLPASTGVTIDCWPLTTPGNRRSVTPGNPMRARFESTLDSISGFLALEITYHDSDTRTQFVVPVTLTGLPAHRDRHLMRALIGNAERFLRYLLALLDEDQSQMDLLDVVDHVGTEQSADPAMGAFSLPVLEKLLRTMRRDPNKLLAIHPLVTDLDSDDALPPGFFDLWKTMHEVALGSSKR
jgi:hypothetical protein